MVCSPNVRGAGVCVATLGFFACNDALIKFVMQTLPELQAVFLRGLFVVPILAAAAARRKELWTRVEARHRRMLFGTCAASALNTYTFLGAIHRGPIADVAVVLALQPLLVMVGAALIMRETIGRANWLLACIGMLSVVVVSRPTAEGGLRPWLLFALASSLLGTARDIFARRIKEVPSTQVAALSAVAITLCAGLGSIPTAAWAAPRASDVALLAAASAFVACALVGSVLQMRLGDTGFVQPFRYSFILWGLLFDVCVFATPPDEYTIFGALLVVGTGVASLSLERRRLAAAEDGKARALPPAPPEVAPDESGEGTSP